MSFYLIQVFFFLFDCTIFQQMQLLLFVHTLLKTKKRHPDLNRRDPEEAASENERMNPVN